MLEPVLWPSPAAFVLEDWGHNLQALGCAAAYPEEVVCEACGGLCQRMRVPPVGT